MLLGILCRYQDAVRLTSREPSYCERINSTSISILFGLENAHVKADTELGYAFNQLDTSCVPPTFGIANETRCAKRKSLINANAVMSRAAIKTNDPIQLLVRHRCMSIPQSRVSRTTLATPTLKIYVQAIITVKIGESECRSGGMVDAKVSKTFGL